MFSGRIDVRMTSLHRVPNRASALAASPVRAVAVTPRLDVGRPESSERHRLAVVPSGERLGEVVRKPSRPSRTAVRTGHSARAGSIAALVERASAEPLVAVAPSEPLIAVR
ncbi:hypothetical protein J2S53_003820 [Actinopolyspora lacussalsi]|nr:hypothetical protein [Actinopolyspora lacussalsi]